MFEQVSKGESKNRLGDWVLRGGIALAFVLFGLDKFPSAPAAPWVKFYQEIGIGQWFRYFTGVVEIVGGTLVLIPRTAQAGLAVLGATMAAAAIILDFVIRRPVDSIVSTGFFIVIAAFWWVRRRD
jgi:uncharacterized membrane protein YphA (DoxX/SURF4 family)